MPAWRQNLYLVNWIVCCSPFQAIYRDLQVSKKLTCGSALKKAGVSVCGSVCNYNHGKRTRRAQENLGVGLFPKDMFL